MFCFIKKITRDFYFIFLYNILDVLHIFQNNEKIIKKLHVCLANFSGETK